MSKSALNDVIDLQAPVSIVPKADIPKHDKYIVEQHYFTIYPTNAGPFSYTGTQDVVFEFDSQNELLDMSRSYVEFEFVSLGATVCLDADAHSVFSRMTLGTERDIVFKTVPVTIFATLLRKLIQLVLISVIRIGKIGLTI